VGAHAAWISQRRRAAWVAEAVAVAAMGAEAGTVVVDGEGWLPASWVPPPNLWLLRIAFELQSLVGLP
jgi:hypothetical protein